MELEFLYVRLKGFRSFVHTQTFKFTNKSNGVYFLTGNNMLDPSLGANAAGKSTIWEGLIWCFFGKTSRNLRADTVVNWDGLEKCEVSVGLKVDGNVYHVRRTQKPNTFKVRLGRTDKWETMTDARLFGLVPLNFDSFLYSIVISQFQKMFIELPPVEKARIFSSVMDVDKWLELSRLASISAEEFKAEGEKFHRKLANIQGQIEALEVDQEEQAEKWEADRKQRLRQARRNLKVDEEELDRVDNDLEEAKSDIKILAERRDDLLHHLADYDMSLKEFAHSKEGLVETIIGFEKEIDHWQEHIANIEDDKGTCSRCGQELTEKHVRKELRIARGQIKRTEGQKEYVLAKLNELRVDESELVNQRRAASMDGKKLKERLISAEKDLAVSTQRRKDITRSINSQKGFISTISSEVNPWYSSAENVKYKRGLLLVKESVTEGKIKKIVREEEEARYWVKGFKELRFSLMEQMLKGLELETNNALSALGMEDWEILYNMQETTRKGTEKKGFFAEIVSPYVAKPVPWEVWSGGETARLKLASAIGLANFIHYQMGITCNIEVWDEPSNFLSPQGINDLLTHLQHRALTEGKQIWFVDHRAVDHGAFVGKWTVVKDDEGSFILENE